MTVLLPTDLTTVDRIKFMFPWELYDENRCVYDTAACISLRGLIEL